MIFISSFWGPAIVSADDSLPPDPVSETQTVEEPGETPNDETGQEGTEQVSDTEEGGETLTPGEVLEALPEGVGVNVVDENGDPLPLASSAASDVIAGQLNRISYQCLGAAFGGDTFITIAQVVTDMDSCIGAGGTINGSLTFSTGIFADEVVVENTTSYSGLTSIIGAGSWLTHINQLYLTNQVANISMSGLTSNLIQMGSSNGNITLSDVSVGGSTANQALWLDAPEGDITLTDVTVSNNDKTGIQVDSAKSLTANHVVASNNGDQDTNPFSTNPIAYGMYVTNAGNVMIGKNSKGNSTFNENGKSGLVLIGSENVNISNTVASGNFYTGIDIFDGLSITINDTVASNNFYEGIGIQNVDDINVVNMTNVVANGNGDLGVDIWGEGDKIGQVNITNLTASNNNPSDNGDEPWYGGLYIDSTNDVNIEDSTFSGNGNYQLIIDNSYFEEDTDVYLKGITAEGGLDWFGTDNIAIFGGGENGYIQDVYLEDITTSLAYYDGLYLWGNNDVELKNINAFGNGFGDDCWGVHVENNYGKVSLSDSTINNNAEAGATIRNVGGDINIDNVTVEDNGWYYDEEEDDDYWGDGRGLDIRYFSGNVTIMNTLLQDNGYHGINVYSEDSESPQIYLENVISNSSFEGSGIRIDVYGDEGSMVTIKNSTSNDNGYYGVQVAGNTNASLLCVEAEDNSDGDIAIEIAGELVELDCVPVAPEKDQESDPQGVFVNVNGGEQVPLSCDAAFTILQMLSGSNVMFKGFCGTNSSLNEVNYASLPGALPEGAEFIAGVVELVDGGTNQAIPDGGTAQVNITFPEGAEGSQEVLFWDEAAGEWVRVPEKGNESSFNASDPAMKVLSGVISSGNTLSFTVNFTGTFVVVNR